MIRRRWGDRTTPRTTGPTKRGQPTDCDTPVLGPLDGSIWRLADEEAAWDVQDGDELTLHPLGGSDSEIIASAPQMDWLFVRLPEATCP